MKHINIIKLVVICSLLNGVSPLNASDETPAPMKNSVSWIYQIEGEFEEVKDDLIRAIQNKGAVVSYTAHASDMLSRTALASNIKENVYSKAEVILFCKSELSHNTVQSDPHSLILCPFPIAIYALTGKPKTIYLTIRNPPEGFAAYEAVHQLLESIINDTLEF